MKVLKLIGIILLALVLLGVAGGGFAWWKGGRLLTRTFDVPVVSLTLPTDSAGLARGAHVGRTIAKCGDCHGANLGGGVVLDDMPFARVVAPNLTRGRGGIGAARTDAELLTAVRHGVGPGGRGLLIMASEAYIHLTDGDLAAVVAWVRSMPDVDSDLPATALGPVGRFVAATGTIDSLVPASYIDHERPAPWAAPEDTTVAYGRYLAYVGGCVACHGPSLSGRAAPADPASPPSANLTPGGRPQWTETDLLRLLREGRGLDGRAIDDRFMPWRSSGAMTDAEIHALWLFLQSLPAKQFDEP